jgi:3-dehydroquinate synthetase
MVAALRLSVLEIGLDPVVAIEIESILRQLGLPTRLDRIPGSRFWKALGRDKKRGRAGLRVILCRQSVNLKSLNCRRLPPFGASF